MKIDSNELQQLAAAAPRLDLYAGIHKALRCAMADALVALGQLDVDDAAELAVTSQRMQDLLAFCASHVRHENDFVHAAMEARAPGASAAVAHDHDEHLAEIEQLARQCRALPQAAEQDRERAALALYRAFSGFVAHNFAHMLVEETAHNQVLWAHYTDAELADLHDALVASIPPEEMMVVARWLVVAMNPAERCMLLADLRAKAPPPAFDAVLAAVQPHLGTSAWAKLARGLGLAPAPGLVSA